MNRFVVFGIAAFFAIVGLALTGGEKQAQAGHGCHGCDGGCDGGGCHGCNGGGHRCQGRCHGRNRGHRCHGRCNGRCNGCNGGCHGGCHGGCGGAPAEAPKAAPPPAEKKAASLDRAPLSFHEVSFRR